MDYKFHRPQPACHRTGRGFAVGEEFFSALVRGANGLERLDIAAEAWDGPPEAAVAWWRARQGAAADTGPMLAPVEVLLDALEALEDDPADAPLRYLLALQLVRRRALRIEGDAGERATAPGTIVFSCRRRDRDYHVEPVGPDAMADPAVSSRLTALLWSGEAA
jgi:hypothetical protein